MDDNRGKGRDRERRGMKEERLKLIERGKKTQREKGEKGGRAREEE